MFVLVRHAHAGDKKTWTGADSLRPLSPTGWQQAKGLAENLLSLMQPARLLASPYVRCHQTLTTLAQRSGRIIQSSDLLVPDASPAELDHYITRSERDLFVYCTHGETLKALLGRWLDVGSAQLMVDGTPTRENRTEKGAAWLVLTDGPRTAHYLRPLHFGPALDGAAAERAGKTPVGAEEGT